jgi:transcriptional regulator with XRE-family HTH domain
MFPDFARVLTEARNRAQLTQEALAGKAGMDRSYVSQLERGLKIPTLKSLFRLAEALDVRPSELVKRIEKHDDRWK